MMTPDRSLGDLRPIQPAPPLTRCGIDQTQVGSKYLLNAVEYATGWLESRVVPNADFASSVPLLLYIIQTFGTPRKIINDNACCFSGTDAKYFQQQHGLTVTHTSAGRPQSNSKVEQANGILKRILARAILDTPNPTLAQILTRAVMTYNRRIAPTGYSPYFLLFGTQPPSNELVYPAYTREAIEKEEQMWANELVKSHSAPISRNYVNSMKASRGKIREYSQEKKALMRTYAPGDWVLRVRQRRHNFEPYYDGPWAIAACHSGNTYSLVLPGGYKMVNHYNSTNLFPAYSRDGHPVRSLWYGSKRMLDHDRNRLKASVGL